MVLKNRSSLFTGQVRESAANVLECSVDRGENGDIGRRVDGLGKVGRVDSTKESTQASFLGNSADVRGDGEQAVNDVNDFLLVSVDLHVLLEVRNSTHHRHQMQYPRGGVSQLELDDR